MDEDHTLSDESLAREIEAVLAVNASPELVARIRERVATERESTGWSWSVGWVGVSMITAAVAVVLLSALPLRAPVDPGAGRSSVVDERVRVPEVPDVALPAEVSEPEPVAVPAVRRVRSVRRQSPRADVVISSDEAAALQQLFNAIAARRVAPSVLPEFDSPTPLAPIAEIVLEPIALSLPVRLDSVEGVRQ